MLQKQYLFVVGAPRSGTTWLQIMLGDHPQVATTVELSVFNRYVSPWLDIYRREKANIDEGRWHQGMPVVWSRDELLDFLREFVARVYQKVLEKKPGSTHILDKQPLYSRHVLEISELLPQARFIHLIRDGRDVAVSMLAARESMGFGARSMAEAAGQWVEMVHAAQVGRQLGDRYIELYYRDLLSDGPARLKQIMDFCGLPMTEDRARAVVEAHSFEKLRDARRSADPDVKLQEAHYRRGKRGTWKEEMSAEDRLVFDRIAGQLLLDLGFVNDRSWMSEGCSDWQLKLTPVISRLQGVRRRAGRAVAALAGH